MKNYAKRKSTKKQNAPTEKKNQPVGNYYFVVLKWANFLSVCRRVTTTYEKFQTSWRHPKESQSRASYIMKIVQSSTMFWSEWVLNWICQRKWKWMSLIKLKWMIHHYQCMLVLCWTGNKVVWSPAYSSIFLSQFT